VPVINVNLGQRKYPIVIGSDVLSQLRKHLAKLVDGGRLFVFYDAHVYALHRQRIQTQLKGLKGNIQEMVVPIGERAKSAAVLSKIYAFLFDEKISRSDFILACGGGVTSDLIGYAAATTLRGIRWGIVSTTLVGMADAAIGGKTGINHPQGKNLIGAFWQPSFVLCDSSFLKTLPARHLIAGLGEVVKYGGLSGGRMLSVIEKFLAQDDLYHEKLLSKLIYLSASYKADIVTKDERESGLRMLLNLGHTFAHAVENAAGYGKVLHGEAVILGLLVAVQLSCQLKPRRAKHLADYSRIINQMVHLIPYRKISCEKALTAMQLDKKRTGTAHRFVLLDKPGRAFIACDVSPRLIKSSLENMLNVYKIEGGMDAPNLSH
jgi:3-dehydroquinate synthase